MSDTVKEIEVCLIKGVEGFCISLNDRRICGHKPWGGGLIIKSWKLRDSDIIHIKEQIDKYLANTQNQ